MKNYRDMGIETVKLTIGERTWTNKIKWSSDRAENDAYTAGDVGVLWAADRISDLERKLAELREAARELVVNAEWDTDISSVDTGDLKELKAALSKGE